MTSMRLEPSLQQKVEMRIAPHIIQSVEVLALPTLELQKFIQEQLEVNPALEYKEETEETDEYNKQENLEENREVDLEKPIDDDSLNNFENIDRELDEYFSENKVQKKVQEEDKKLEAMQNTAAKPISLQDYLFQQFVLLDMPDKLKEVGQNIIYNIDREGYFRCDISEVMKDLSESVTEEEVLKALEFIQSLEPRGIGARDLKECLLLQLEQDEPDYYFKKELIEKYLEDIYNNKYPKISKETGKDIEEVKRAIKSLQKLNPKPGAEYSSESSHVIRPDVIIENIAGDYIVIIEDDYLSDLRINTVYSKFLTNKNKKLTEKAKDFIKKKVESAQWIIDSIKQRQNTLRRVSEKILEHQKEFMEHGVTRLKPLKMQDLADSINVHVSTISRAISDKYAQTPMGVFPLKFFFTGSVDKKGGKNESRVSVKERILEIVSNENKKNPLSDEEISEMLEKKAGLKIARRTITKYRKVLNIPSSRKRKEY